LGLRRNSNSGSGDARAAAGKGSHRLLRRITEDFNGGPERLGMDDRGVDSAGLTGASRSIGTGDAADAGSAGDATGEVAR
jgi:hypothetical protein